MKRILTLALLATTALSAPAFAAGLSLGGSSSTSASTSNNAGASIGGSSIGVGADVGIGAQNRSSASSMSNDRTANGGVRDQGTSDVDTRASIYGSNTDNNVNDTLNDNRVSLDEQRLNAETRQNLDAQLNENVDTQINTTPVSPETASGSTSIGGTARTAAETNLNSATGLATGATASASQSARVQTLNSADVKLVQQALRQEGLFNGTADGVWGPRTASAVQQFQQQNQIGATGTLDAQTLNKLGVQLQSRSSAGISGSAN